MARESAKTRRVQNFTQAGARRALSETPARRVDVPDGRAVVP